MDDTRIDAAPTPAHIFAYRAFRSVFVGSPESSPVRHSIEPHRLNDNKENAIRSPVRGSRFVTSPVKSKRNAEHVPENSNLSLTPKRQRTNPVSPTKSILKKPNIPTPRRAELRDVTVTFKDVRMSVSPEMARRGSPTRTRSQPDLRNTLAALSSVAMSAPVARVASASQIEGSKKVDKNQAVSQVSRDVDLDGYMAQTEKEMRRLIKYGQKWREYSRKQDDENARLRALIEDLQQENDRLRQKSDTKSDNVRSSSSTIAAAVASQKSADAKAPKQRDQPFDLENRSRAKEPEKWKIPLKSLDHEKQRSKSTSMLKKTTEELYQSATNANRDTYEPGRQKDFGIKSGQNTFKQSLMRRLEEDNAHQHKEDVPPAKESAPSKQAPRDADTSVADPPKSAAEFSSEDTRKAAARERLRLRREAKVATIRTSSARDTNSGHDPSRDNEESQVDWMAMV